MFFSKNKQSENKWKQKAKKRRCSEVRLFKKIKALRKSRDKWKTRAEKYQSEVENLNEVIKKNS
jgi:hypothetical protein